MRKDTMIVTKQEFDSLYTDTITKKEYYRVIKKINKRMDEIVRGIATDLEWWDYGNAPSSADNGTGYFDDAAYKKDVEICGEFSLEDPFNSHRLIPTSWLWEDFEEEYKKEVEKDRLIEERKKKKKKEPNTIRESIKNKLTAEELKYVKFVK